MSCATLLGSSSPIGHNLIPTQTLVSNIAMDPIERRNKYFILVPYVIPVLVGMTAGVIIALDPAEELRMDVALHEDTSGDRNVYHEVRMGNVPHVNGCGIPDTGNMMHHTANISGISWHLGREVDHLPLAAHCRQDP